LMNQFELHTTARPESLSETVRRVIGGLLKNVRVSRMTTLARQVDSNIVPERLIATLSQFFGVLGIVLAGIGMYGLLAYAVARRTNEIGIRMALGATGRDVSSLVLRDAFRMVCGGLVAGIVLLLLSRPLAMSLIPDLKPDTTEASILGSWIIISVALLAAYVPVRRAVRVDPMSALRHD
ncbi:MAG TPA: FtsX-like permease family protein, partial [Bryobacteraceae bacterium]